MAMHQRRRRGYRWRVSLERGHGLRLTPCADERNRITHVFLADPASAVGQGSVDAYVEIGARNILLASLSAERPRVELDPAVFVNENFALYVTPQGVDSDADDYTDSDADTDTDTDSDSDADTIVVKFEGNLSFATPPPREEEESDGTDTDDEEDAMSSDYEDGLQLDTEVEGPSDTASCDEEEEESDGEVGGSAVTASGFSSNVLRRRRNLLPEAEGRSLGARNAVHTEHVRPVAAVAFSGIFAFIYLMTFIILVMYSVL